MYRRLSNIEGTVVIFYRVGHDGSPAKDVQPAWVLPEGAVEWDEGAATATAPAPPPLLEKEEKEEEDGVASNNSTAAPAPGGDSVADSVSATANGTLTSSAGDAASVDSADVTSTPTGAGVQIVAMATPPTLTFKRSNANQAPLEKYIMALFQAAYTGQLGVGEVTWPRNCTNLTARPLPTLQSTRKNVTQRKLYHAHDTFLNPLL